MFLMLFHQYQFTPRMYYSRRPKQQRDGGETITRPHSSLVRSRISSRTGRYMQRPQSAITPTMKSMQIQRPKSAITPTIRTMQIQRPQSALTPTRRELKIQHPQSALTPTRRELKIQRPQSALTPTRSAMQIQRPQSAMARSPKYSFGRRDRSIR